MTATTSTTAPTKRTLDRVAVSVRPTHADTIRRSPASTAQHRLPLAMMSATTGLLVLAFALQLAVYGHGGHVALSDLPRVLLHRQIGPHAVPYLDRALEYPVGSGLLLYVAVLVAPQPLGAFFVTAVVAAGLCIAITVVLERRCGARAWRWALGMPVFLYAFQNWDVFAVAALLAAVLAYERRRDLLAGGLLAVGAAVKLFPAFAAPPLVAARWAGGDRRGAVRLAAGAVGVFALVNLPVAIARPGGWWWTFAFQGRRQASWGTAWFYLYRVVGLPVHGASGSQLANGLSLVVLVAGIGWLTLRTVRAKVSPVAVAGAAVAIFLLADKVYSPTYDIWLVVFFVLLPLGRRVWATFCVVDLAVFALVYGAFHGIVPTDLTRIVLPFLVVVRVGVLAYLIASATRRSTPAIAPETASGDEGYRAVPCSSSA